MANNPRQAPWPITVTGATVGSKFTCAATIGGSTYTCTGDSATLALLALCRRLVEEGCDPLCATTGTGGVIADIISAV